MHVMPRAGSQQATGLDPTVDEAFVVGDDLGLTRA